MANQLRHYILGLSPYLRRISICTGDRIHYSDCHFSDLVVSESDNPLSSKDTGKRLKPDYNLLPSNVLNLKDDKKMIMTKITNIIIENPPSEIENITPKANTLIPYLICF